MDCEPVFSIYNLSASSIENEVFITTQCMQNSVKFALFFGNLFLWSILGIWLVVLLCSDFVRTGRTVNLRKKIYCYCIASTIFEIIGAALNLGSVTHVARYFIYGPSQVFVRRAVHLSIIAWSDAIGAISHDKNIPPLLRKSKIYIYTIEIIMLIACIGIGIIASMVQYQHIEDYLYSFNLTYLIFIDLINVYGTANAIIMAVLSKKLAKLCRSTDDMGVGSKENMEMSERLNTMSFFTVSFIPFEFGLCLLPLWLLSPHGLNNISYYYYIGYKFPTLFGAFIMPWAVTKRGSMFGLLSNHSHNTSSHNSGGIEARTHKRSISLHSGSNTDSAHN
jgi:hypothetical protein